MTALLFIWQLPQIIIGATIRALMGKKILRRIGNVRIYAWSHRSGVSLGWFCFVPEEAGKEMICHEYGHTRQSALLGPLYLLIIGIPSFLWAILWRSGVIRRDYHSFYTERWAEKEGSLLH